MQNERRYAEYRYAEYRYAEYRYAIVMLSIALPDRVLCSAVTVRMLFWVGFLNVILPSVKLLNVASPDLALSTDIVPNQFPKVLETYLPFFLPLTLSA